MSDVLLLKTKSTVDNQEAIELLERYLDMAKRRELCDICLVATLPNRTFQSQMTGTWDQGLRLAGVTWLQHMCLNIMQETAK